jgi:hypothetical protein
MKGVVRLIEYVYGSEWSLSRGCERSQSIKSEGCDNYHHVLAALN